MITLNEDWTATVVGEAHKYRIPIAKLAERSGYAQTYVSSVLNGSKFKAETPDGTRERIEGALQELIAEREAELAEQDSSNPGAEA